MYHLTNKIESQNNMNQVRQIKESRWVREKRLDFVYVLMFFSVLELGCICCVLTKMFGLYCINFISIARTF